MQSFGPSAGPTVCSLTSAALLLGLDGDIANPNPNPDRNPNPNPHPNPGPNPNPNPNTGQIDLRARGKALAAP